MTRADIRDWRDGYDAAGILDDDKPPPALRDRVASADLIVASDMPRALQTARRLTDRELTILPIVRETPPPIPEWKHLRLPRHVWEWMALVRWGYWILTGIRGPADALDRAAKAAECLNGLSAKYPHIVVVTHGTFRRLLAYKLEDDGWRWADGTRRSYRHWSVWSFEK